MRGGEGPLRGPPGDFNPVPGVAAAALVWKKERKKSALRVGPAGFGGATGASESKTRGADVEGRPRGQGRPAGRPWANQPQMRTQRAEPVVSARRRRRALETAPKTTFEIWIPGAQIARPAGAPRPSLWRGVAWASPGWRGRGGCPDVGRGWARGRRRTLPVALLRLRPPRAATPRRGPAGARVAPGMPRTCRGATTWRRAGPVVPPACPAGPSHLAPQLQPRAARCGGTPGRQGFGHPKERRPFAGGVPKSAHMGVRAQRAEGRP